MRRYPLDSSSYEYIRIRVQVCVPVVLWHSRQSVCELLSKRNLQCMDPMIEAAKSGLAVNMASLPTLSAGGVSYAAGQQAPAEVVDADRVQAIIARGREATFAELNSELKKQTELCKTNLAQFKAIGDVASFKRY